MNKMNIKILIKMMTINEFKQKFTLNIYNNFININKISIFFNKTIFFYINFFDFL